MLIKVIPTQKYHGPRGRVPVLSTVHSEMHTFLEPNIEKPMQSATQVHSGLQHLHAGLVLVRQPKLTAWKTVPFVILNVAGSLLEDIVKVTLSTYCFNTLAPAIPKCSRIARTPCLACC